MRLRPSYTPVAIDAAAVATQAVALDLVGIVAKRADAPYQAGRQTTWLKIKHKGYWRQEAVRFGR